MRTMSTTQAARKLGYSDDTIRRQAERGSIPAVRVGRTWRVSAEWVERVVLKLRPAATTATR